jgi:deoxyuridine 5'-triphosphate nucleotidohydrolase
MKIQILQFLLLLAEKLYTKLKTSHENNIISETSKKIEVLEKMLNLTGGSKTILDELKKQLIPSKNIDVSITSKPKLLVKKLDPAAQIPTRSEGNAGYDLYSIEDATLKPGERRLIKTGISLKPPFGYYGSIRDRSGMAFKNGGHVLAGVIDETYTGEVGIVLLNTDKEKDLVINIGDRPAQIVFEEYGQFELSEVSELPLTNRNDSGYGSSGK